MTTLLLRGALRPLRSLALLKPTLQRHSLAQLQPYPLATRHSLHSSSVRLNSATAQPASHPMAASLSGVAANPAERPVQIYVGNLGADIDAERLKQELAMYQGVGEVSVVMNPETGVSRGFAFVDFASVEAAQFVIDDAHGKDLDGKALIVAPSKQSMPTRAEIKVAVRNPPSRRLHVVNLTRDLGEMAIREVFTQYGGEIERIQRLKARNTGLPNGVAFITFVTQESANKALEALHNTELGGRVVQINYAASLTSKQPAFGKKADARPPRDDAAPRETRGASRGSYGSEDRFSSSSGGRKSYGSSERSDFALRERSSYGSREQRSYGDREQRGYGDREQRGYGRDEGSNYGASERSEYRDRRAKSNYGDREGRGFTVGKQRPFGDREQRSDGDREQRAYGGDREQRSSSYADRERSSSSGGYGGGERSSYSSSRGDSQRGGYSSGGRGDYNSGERSFGGGERSNYSRGDRSGGAGDRGGYGRDRGSYGGDRGRDRWA